MKLKLDKNSRSLILLGGAAVLAFVPAARQKLASWWTGPQASKMAYGFGIGGPKNGLEAALQTPADPLSGDVLAPETGDHVPFWSGLADATIAPFQDWVETNAGKLVADLQGKPAPSGGGVMPNASQTIGYGSGQSVTPAPGVGRMGVERGQGDPILVVGDGWVTR